MIDHHYYSAQLRRYLLQFGAIFTGLKVRFGRDASGESRLVSVPIQYGSRDQVVAAIYAGDTSNKMIQLPMMSFYMTGLELAPERRKGVGLTHRRPFMDINEPFPENLRVAERYMPIPYNMTVDLYLYVSNTDQLHQVLEQVLMLFDPILMIQTTDETFDWTKLTYVELVNITNEENFPPGADRRVIQWTLSFTVPIWITPPMDIKQTVVERIRLQIWDADNLTLNEFSVDGDPMPFDGEILTRIEIDGQP